MAKPAQLALAQLSSPGHTATRGPGLAELQVFIAPYERTAMMLMRPQICAIEGSALVYVIAKPV
jgi:hypothetical protein